MIDPRLAGVTTLAQGAVNPLAAQSLAQGRPGAIEIPTGTVETKYEPTTERKIMGAQTKAASGELDSAYDDQVKALEEKKAGDVQREGITQQGLEAQSDVAGDKASALATLAKQREDWRIKREAERDREIEDFLKVQNSKTVGDVTPIRQLVSSLAVGFGGYAASMNGGPNTAWEIFKTGEENARKAKEAELKKQVERMAASGKNAEEMLKYFNQEHDAIEKLFVARNDVAEKQAAALKATVPSAGPAADIVIAEAKQRKAELKRNFSANYDETIREPGTTTQTSSGAKAEGQQTVDSSTKQAVINARETARSMSELGDFVKKNPEAWKEYQDAALAEAELEASKQGNEKLISSLQGIGVAKVALDQRLQTPEARRINAMIAPMITAKAREMDPIGALNKDAYINASKSLNLFTGPADEVAGKAYEYADKNNRIADQ